MCRAFPVATGTTSGHWRSACLRQGRLLHTLGRSHDAVLHLATPSVTAAIRARDVCGRPERHIYRVLSELACYCAPAVKHVP